MPHNTFYDDYETFIDLVQETIGASFTISYNEKEDKHLLRFTNLKWTIKGDSISCIVKKGIEFIESNRELTNPRYKKYLIGSFIMSIKRTKNG